MALFLTFSVLAPQCTCCTHSLVDPTHWPLYTCLQFTADELFPCSPPPPNKQLYFKLSNRNKWHLTCFSCNFQPSIRKFSFTIALPKIPFTEQHIFSSVLGTFTPWLSLSLVIGLFNFFFFFLHCTLLFFFLRKRNRK